MLIDGKKLKSRRVWGYGSLVLFAISMTGLSWLYEAQGTFRKNPLECSLPTTIDFDKIEVWSESLQVSEPFQPPFMSEFKQCDKYLIFVGASHSTDEESPTFQTIKSAFLKMKPQFVIAEGFPTEMGESPTAVVDAAKNCALTNFKSCPELLYTAHLAVKNSVPFIGGEPNDKYVYGQISKLGYSIEDLVAYYIVRQIPQWFMEGHSENEIGNLINREINLIRKTIPLASEYDLTSFQAWFKSNMGRTFKPETIKNNDIAPNETGTLLNRLAATTGKIRDLFIIEKIQTALQLHDRVLIVYGSGHLATQRKALEEFLGDPKNSKPY